jgi:hypothetical protein
VTVLRGICLAAALLALVASVLLAEPRGTPLFALSALVLFIVGAGSIAADAVPLRSRLALICSVLTPLSALWLALGGFAGLPAPVAVLPAVAVTVAPLVARQLA